MSDVLTSSGVEMVVVGGNDGGSLPGRQAFPACEATAAKGAEEEEEEEKDVRRRT